MMRVSLRWAFPVSFLLAATVLFPAFSRAQSNATIHGTISDPSGRVMARADVTLLGSMISVATAQTDSRGEYQFTGLQSGTYIVAANAPGLTNVSEEIKLQDGGDVSADLRLKLSAVQTQVIVSASLGGALAPQVGSSTTVVSREDIENQGINTVADSLRNVPGVEINRTGQMGAVTSAFIRGGTSNYNLVMVDGIPLNDFGGGFDLATLPAQGVDRVELMRGPESALYGSDALAGVINVVT